MSVRWPWRAVACLGSSALALCYSLAAIWQPLATEAECGRRLQPWRRGTQVAFTSHSASLGCTPARRGATAALQSRRSLPGGSEVEWRTEKPTQPEQRWPFWPVLPIAPYERRRTIRREILPGQLWTFEQKQGIYYVHVPIRMTVYKMQRRSGSSGGGLFVYAPVAPTDECVALLRELEAEHGAVAYIVLPTVAVEHKYFVGPFARAFPSAQVWVCPGQFSVPLPLPLTFLGFPGERLRFLPKDPTSQMIPQDWRDEGIDYRVLGPIGKDVNTGAFAEAVFYLGRVRALLAVDLVLSVPAEVPEIIAEDPRALAFHARNGPLEQVETTPEALSRGWRRICIFSLLFETTAIKVQTVPEAVRDAFMSRAPEFGWSGFLPCNYRERWQETFEALRGGGGLLVPPILSELILNRYLGSDVWPFVEEVSSAFRGAELVVPAHFAAPVRAGTEDFRDAFRRAFGEPPGGVSIPVLSWLTGPRPGPQPLEADLRFVREIADSLTSLGVINSPERLTYGAGEPA